MPFGEENDLARKTQTFVTHGAETSGACLELMGDTKFGYETGRDWEIGMALRRVIDDVDGGEKGSLCRRMEAFRNHI